MKGKRGMKILEILNSKPVIGALIFIMLSLATVLAGNVIVKEGSMEIGNDLNSSGVLYVNSTTGNVGIGTSSPSSKLEVVSNVNITGNLKVDGNVNITGNLTVGGSGTFVNITTDEAQSSGAYAYAYAYCPNGYTIIYCALSYTMNRDPNGNADYQHRWADFSGNGCVATAYAANGLARAKTRGLCVKTS